MQVNSRQKRHAARAQARNATRMAKANGTASFVVGASPYAPEKVAGKTAGRMTCYVPGALCRMEHKRKLYGRHSLK